MKKLFCVLAILLFSFSATAVDWNLIDPGADRFVMWDDSATGAEVVWGTFGTGLSVSGTTVSVGDLSATYQPTDADLPAIAALTPVEKKIIVGNATPAWSVSSYTIDAPGASGAVMCSDGTNWTRCTSITGSFDIGTSTASGHAVTMDADGILQTAFTALLPDAADNATLGSATYEWSDLYLADGGVIYFQNDQSVYLTPSSALLTLTGAFTATGVVTASAGVTIADSQVLTFDESAADPNDADIQLSATDGVFKIAAANGANNEDLTIDLDATSNTATIGSSTGLTMVTTGSIPLGGALPIVVNSDTSAYSVTSTQANNGTFFITTNAATTTYTLPAASAGMHACFRMGQGNAQVLRIDTDGTDYIVMSTGARTSAAGDYYGASSSASNQICVVAFNSTDWYVTSYIGTWTEE